MRNRFLPLAILTALIMLLAQGCSTTEIVLNHSHLEKMSSVKLVRYQSPPVLKLTAGAKVAAITGGLLGPVGAVAGAGVGKSIAARHGKELQEQYNLPDFGEIVMERLTDQIPKELPGWPPLMIEKETATEESISKMDGYVAALNVNLVMIDDTHGLQTMAESIILDPSKNMVCHKKFIYNPVKLSRPTKLDQLTADNGKLLLDEFAFAADKTTSSFIEHLRGPQP
jgi:hypothetical protein